jgi:hypothetical protein
MTTLTFAGYSRPEAGKQAEVVSLTKDPLINRNMSIHDNAPMYNVVFIFSV